MPLKSSTEKKKMVPVKNTGLTSTKASRFESTGSAESLLAFARSMWLILKGQKESS